MISKRGKCRIIFFNAFRSRTSLFGSQRLQDGSLVLLHCLVRVLGQGQDRQTLQSQEAHVGIAVNEKVAQNRASHDLQIGIAVVGGFRNKEQEVNGFIFETEETAASKIHLS